VSDAGTDAVALAKRLRDCLTTGDVDGVAAIYHPDIVGWRNVDGRELTHRQMLKIVEFLATRVTDVRYEEVQVQPTPGGYVQQHVLRAVAPDGTPVEVPACLVVTVEDGTIRRLDEYMDAAALAPLTR